MSWQPWMKFAILGSTYARALQNAGARAGRTFTPNAFDHIASQPRAVLKPGLSSYVREPGVLPPTAQSTAMQGLASRLPWAGEEHTTPAMSAKAPARFDRVLEQHGLVHNTPAGQPTAQQRIDAAFGRDQSDRADWLAKERAAPAPAAATSVIRKPSQLGAQPATAVLPAPASTAVLSAGGARLPANVASAFGQTNSNAPRAHAPTDPPSPRKFPRAKFTMDKAAAALPTAVGVGIPLAVGAGMLATKPGIQSNLHNLMAGGGSTQEQDVAGEIPDPVMQQAQAIHQHLADRGLDPRTMRIGIDAPPGSGKTTLARAIAKQTGMSHYGLDWEPGHAWKSTIGLGRNVENTPHAPRAGEILEHYLLNRTHDPELFDAQIHLRRDPNVIRQQITQRGRSAAASDFMDLDKSLQVADLGFDTLDGDEINLGSGAVMKLRPHEGWGNQLDQRLTAAGIDPAGLSRHEKLLTLHSGQRTTGAGWTPYVKNPFTPAQTLALGASVPLGILAARALSRAPKVATEKTAIGKRQTSRIQKALMDMGLTQPVPNRESRDGWYTAHAALTGRDKNRPSKMEDYQREFSPVYEDPSAITKKQRQDMVPPQQRRNEIDHTRRLDELMTSGRHDKRDIVDVPFIDDPTEAARQPGVNPDRIAWRGELPKPDFDPTPSAPKGSRWYSGMPNVSSGYIEPGLGGRSLHERATNTGRLHAFALNKVPDQHQGPWTYHIAVDPRTNSIPTSPNAGRSDAGLSPIYEKVMDVEHVPSPLTTYKPLLTPGKFIREKGPNILQEGLPSSVRPHEATRASLQKMAPGLSQSLRSRGAILKKIK